MYVSVCVLFCVCRRQKRTASHSVQRLEELRSRGRLCRPVLCSLHSGQQLRLFCQPCDLPVCLECAATLHRDHRCCPMLDVIDHHGDHIRELVTARLRPRLEQLERSLQKVEQRMFWKWYKCWKYQEWCLKPNFSFLLCDRWKYPKMLCRHEWKKLRARWGRLHGATPVLWKPTACLCCVVWRNSVFNAGMTQ